MKSIYPYALLGALFAVGAVNAATTTTTPVGYTTTTLVPGFNNLGLTLQSPLLVSDAVSAVTATSVTATSASYPTTAATGTIYILEITSGTAIGRTVEVTVTDATHLATVDNLVTAGVLASDTYQLRKAPTLEEIFGTTTSVLTKAAAVTNADVVWVPTATPGTYTRYFQNAAGAWRSATANALAPNTPIIYLDGLFIEKKGAASVALTLTGEVKKVSTAETLVTGFNYLGTVYPVGSTLQNIGFDSALGKAASVTNADVVWVPAATPGTYTRYFLNTSSVWRNATTNTTVTADVALTSAVFVERKATSTASTTLKLVPPTTYSSL